MRAVLPNEAHLNGDEMAIANSITELIGKTPLLYLNRITQGAAARVAVSSKAKIP